MFCFSYPDIPPKVRLVPPTSRRVMVAPGGSVNLTCASLGQPEPTLNWKQDGEIVRAFASRVESPTEPAPKTDGAKTVVIQRLVESTTFTCQASSGVGYDSVIVEVLVTGEGFKKKNFETLNITHF